MSMSCQGSSEMCQWVAIVKLWLTTTDRTRKNSNNMCCEEPDEVG